LTNITDPKIKAYVDKYIAVFKPKTVHLVDGSEAEDAALKAELVAAGTFIKLNETKRPNSYLCRSDPGKNPFP